MKSPIFERALIDASILILQFSFAIELIIFELSFIDAILILISSIDFLPILKGSLEDISVLFFSAFPMFHIVFELPFVDIVTIPELALTIGLAVLDFSFVVCTGVHDKFSLSEGHSLNEGAHIYTAFHEVHGADSMGHLALSYGMGTFH